LRHLLCSLALAAVMIPAAPALASGGKIALTFDDLPALTVLKGQPYVDYLTTRLLRGLRLHHFRVIGFVNEGKLDTDRAAQTANLERWLDAGMGLGNHTFAHSAASEVGARAYIADITKGEPATRGLLAERHERLRWFRHPYLDTGSPAPVRHEIDTWLAEHGYRVAPVTIDAEDWEFAEPYDDAIARHDLIRQKRIRSEYLAYTAMRVAWSQESARILFGRDIAHVMLLHATRLNADTIGDLARVFHRAHLQRTTLDDALRDPAYQTRDSYTGKEGINWLERWALTLHKELPEHGDVDPPKNIEIEYDRVDNDRAGRKTGP